MHAGYQIIIQVLQLAYTTQACISNLKNLCNANKHMTMHISNTTNQSSWACSPYLCASLVQEFWSFHILQRCSLFVHVNVQPLLLCLNFSQSFHNLSQSKAFISLYNLSPFVINFHKKMCFSLMQRFVFGVDGWCLNLVFFMDITWLLERHHLYSFLRYHT